MKEKISHSQLPSGAKLIHIKTSSQPLSYVSAWFRAGARFDPPQKTGLAHFFEHIYGETTESHPEKDTLIKELEENGIKFNAYTSIESTNFYYEQPHEQTMEAISYLQEIIEEATIDKAKVESEKSVILNEEKENRNNPTAYIWRLRNKALWPNSTLGNGFYGDQESIEGIAKDDIIEFKNAYYTSDNLTFVVASPHQTEEIAKKLPKKTTASGQKSTEDDFSDRPKKIIVEERDISQTTMMVAFRTNSIHSNDYPATDLLLHILVNSWISKITRRLRVEENISYWPSGNTEHFSDTGYTSIQFTTENKDARRALSIVLEEISNIKNNKLGAEELEKFKKSYTSSFLQNYETLDDIAWWYGWQGTLGSETLLSPKDYLMIINNTSPEKLRKLAQKYFSSRNRSIVAIGDTTKDRIEEVIKP